MNIKPNTAEPAQTAQKRMNVPNSPIPSTRKLKRKITANAQSQFVDEHIDCAVALTLDGNISGMMNHGIGPRPMPKPNMKMKIATMAKIGVTSTLRVMM